MRSAAMSNSTELSPLKQAFLALQDAQARIAALESARTEPIAVIGIGCRIPGAEAGVAGYWDLLREGRDAVGSGLPDRWREIQACGADDRMPDATRFAALLQRQDRFDAEFFGIAPREAASMDPQQRVLLEVSWEALEHAGISPQSLYGSSTGVFVGMCTSDYSLLQIATTQPMDIDGHFGSGSAHSVASGRLSYILGLRGPSMSIDTACSSSLVAAHFACDAIRRGECDLAIVGGVNAIFTTEASRTFAAAGMLSPTGRCASFAAGADGFVRGEGCGVLVLKSLSAALEDGNRVLGVLLGSAVNHDGPSSGLTVPSGAAQQALLRKALAAAGVAPRAISYVEAHGTGTTLGDPIEAEALGAVLREGRSPEQPLLLGSVKTNIGHLEAAAGVAGLIKLVLSLQHRQLPRHLHFTAPSPHIRWDALGLKVVDAMQPWEPIDGRRIAGISSFGFSGTNAHVIVAEAPAGAASEKPAVRPIDVLPLSARSEAARVALARLYAAQLTVEPETWPDLAHTAAVGRARFAKQLSVRASDGLAAAAALTAFADGRESSTVVASESSPARSRIAFAFTGQGSQYVGMGSAFYASSPTFRRVIDAGEALLSSRLDVPLGAVMRGEHPDAAQLLTQTRYTQPALFVLEYALAMLWRELGVEPSIVLGHSLGEYVAAAIAGVFSFDDALSLVADRAALMQQTAPGAMIAVGAGEPDIRGLLDGWADRVSLAGINGPGQVTLAGEPAAIEALTALCVQRGWRAVSLPVSHAFHSPLLEPIGAAFEARAAQTTYAAPDRTLISNLTGKPIDTIDAAYWRAHARQPVRFSESVHALDALGCDVLLEIGPKPVLLPLAQQLARESTPGRKMIATIAAPGREWESFATALQALDAAGVPIDWSAWDRDYQRRIVDAPTYPFERQRHWIAPSAAPQRVAAAPHSAALPPADSLLGTRLRSALPGAQFELQLTAAGATAWLADHRIGGRAIFPATAFIEMMLAAGNASYGDLRSLDGLAIFAPLELDAERPRIVQTIVDPIEAGSARVRVFADEPSADTGSASVTARFQLLAQARLSGIRLLTHEPADLRAIDARCLNVIDHTEHYRRIAASGADFGPAFNGLTSVHAGDHEALATIVSSIPPVDPVRPHPTLLDACLQTAAATLSPSSASYMPVALGRFEILTDLWPATVLAHARLVKDDAVAPQIDLDIYDANGRPLALLRKLTFQRAGVSSASNAAADIGSWFYQIDWRQTPLADSSGTRLGACVVVGAGLLAQRIATELPDGRGGDPVAAVIYVPPDTDEDPANLGPMSARAGIEEFLTLIRSHVNDGLFPDARLYVVTRNAVPVGDGDVSLRDAALTGTAASVFAELPKLRCTRIDIDMVALADAAGGIAREVLADAPDDWVAYRGGARFVARMQRCEAVARGVDETIAPLRLRSAGGLESLTWESFERAPLHPGEIEIEVHAAPLNFRDVIGVVGLIADRQPIGGECAGTVSRVAPDVTRFRRGDPVVALTSGSFAHYAIATERLTMHKPNGLSFEAAAAQALVYLTADYALNTVARMRRGESVLIHAAAGGVGLAAVELCIRAGMTIYATAGSDAKRAYLRSRGVDHVMNSRSIAFADQVRKLTEQRGVDVVLNCLAGEFIDAGLSVLASGGRFVELGKTDLRTSAEVAARHPGVTYAAFDLTNDLRAEPESAVERLSAIYAGINAGELRAVPHRTYPFAQAKTAFLDLASARHYGKLVLVAEMQRAPAVRADGAYIITGGLSGVGVEVGAWLAQRGVRRIVLAGRRPPSSAVVERIENWRTGGTDVVVVQADVSRFDAVADVVHAAGPGLRGVIHCANVLDDSPLAELTWDRFATVLAPKSVGAWNLHEATAGTELDFFVLFSSWASIVGARGGANYAGANSALDALAYYRRQRGLCALSLDWGAWAEIGWASRVAGGVPLRPGFGAMKPADGLRALEVALRTRMPAQLAIAPVEWPALIEWAGGRLPSLLRDFATTHGEQPIIAAPGAPPSLADVVTAAPERSRRDVAIGHIQKLAAAALGIADSNVLDPARPLAEYGLDSILAVELRNTLMHSLRADVPTTLLFDYPTIGGIAAYSIASLAPTTSTPVPATEDNGDLLDLIERLSDDEVDRRLSGRGVDVA
jgi:acyl transferase domain-containing protein/NADPH:quinone reductase-like Zn-dependent oxidoreductase/acyl carrier protein